MGLFSSYSPRTQLPPISVKFVQDVVYASILVSVLPGFCCMSSYLLSRKLNSLRGRRGVEKEGFVHTSLCGLPPCKTYRRLWICVSHMPRNLEKATILVKGNSPSPQKKKPKTKQKPRDGTNIYIHFILRAHSKN